MRGPTEQNGLSRRGVNSLKAKFAGFLSLIIIATCSSLSWYFIQNKTAAMEDQLRELGSVLVGNLAYNTRYGIFTEDKTLLWQFINGVMEVEPVVYVVVTGPDGQPLAAKSKGKLIDGQPLERTSQVPLYPEPSVAQALFMDDSNGPKITEFKGGMVEAPRPRNEKSSTRSKVTGTEKIYDFAMPVKRRDPGELPFAELSLESQESPARGAAKGGGREKVYGIVQVGLTEASMRQALNGVIMNIAVLTIVIILGGIGATIVLADRIIMPLRGLARVAQRVAEGDLTASVVPHTRDEVGQLTHSFNQMTRSLKDRDRAISSNIDTIKKQVTQLTTLNQAATAISSTLDLDKLLTTVLQLLVENLAFTRMMLVLYDREKGVARIARIAGVPESIERAAHRIKIPVLTDSGIEAELLIHEKTLLVPDIATVADRIYPPVLELARQIAMTSFVAAPLRSERGTLGCLVADRGDERCTQEDLDLLTTIASHVAVAMDNAMAYAQLGQLTQTLEQRVAERTEELRGANEKLRELDQLRSQFFADISHELLTPLTVIKGEAEVTLRGREKPLPEYQAALGRIVHLTNQLSKLVGDLLFLAQSESGTVEIEEHPCSLNEILDQVFQEGKVLALGKSIAVTLSKPEEPLVVVGDRQRLKQLFIILVDNGVNYTEPTGAVEICLEQEGQWARIVISDNGSGIPAEDLPRVFERFYRGKESGARRRVGAGLGLPIAKWIVEAHRGSIALSSTPGRGTLVTIRLPLSLPT